jgi:diphosphate--fructose-6-phosphate 1-phosphotransferase
MRLMGDSPSLSALEVALATHPSYVILAEEVKEKNMTLADIIREISDIVCSRAKVGKNYGTVLIPEGLVDSIPELHLLNSELESILQEDNDNNSNSKLDLSNILSKLTLWSRALLQSLPDYMQSALLSLRGSDKGIKMSQAETERLLAHFVDIELSYRKKKGTYCGKFASLCSFIGYQARGSLPSNFDINFAYNLGYAATHLIKYGYNNYVVTVNNLKLPVNKWTVSGVPISAMMTIDRNKAVIQKSCVDLNGPSYKALLTNKNYSNTIDRYANPGPVQFEGPEEIINSIPISLSLENFDYMIDIKKLQMAFASIEQTCRPGCPNLLLQIATNTLTNLTNTLELCNNENTN